MIPSRRRTVPKRVQRNKKLRQRRGKLHLEQLEHRLLLSLNAPDPSREASQDQAPPWLQAVVPHSSRQADASAWKVNLREVAFVDQNVEDYQILVDAIQSNGATSRVDVVLLDSRQDGLRQITDYLRDARGVAGIHILSHGSAAGLQLGSTRLDGESLDARAAELRSWRAALTEQADMLLYGCNVAGGEQGISLVNNLAALTGADVAASTDLTGAETLGGDWELEYASGPIDVIALLHQKSAAPFQDALVQTLVGTNANDKFAIGRPDLFIQNEDKSHTVGSKFWSFEQNRGTAVDLRGLAGDDEFVFESVPSRLTTQAVSNSVLSGGAGNDLVTFQKIVGKELQFLIASTSPGGDGILAAISNTPVAPKLVEIETLIGGERKNQYVFEDTWNEPLVIDNPFILGERDQRADHFFFHLLNTNGQGLAFNLTRDDLTVVDNSNGNRQVEVPNLDQLATVRGDTSANTTLDLSNIDVPLEATIRPSGTVIVKYDDTQGKSRRIAFDNVNHLVLGRAKNTLKFESGGQLTSISRPPLPLAHYEVVLDYARFRNRPLVNLGPALNLSNGQMSVLTKTADGAAAGNALWHIYARQNPSAIPRTYELDFGDRTTDELETDIALQPGLAATEIVGELERLANVASIVTFGNPQGTIDSPMTFQIQARTAEIPLLGSEDQALAVLGRASDSEWRLVVHAEDGTFRLQADDGLNNEAYSLPISLVDARADSTVIEQALVSLLRNDLLVHGAAVSVDGAGTHEIPWVIRFATANGAQLTYLDTESLVADEERFITIVNEVAGTAPQPHRWELFTRNSANPMNVTGPAHAGGFRLRVTANGQALETEPLIHDAHADEIFAALARLPNVAELRVEGQGTPQFDGLPADPWIIQIADPALDLTANSVALEVVDFNPPLPSMSASGIGGLETGTLNGISDLGVVSVIGADKQNDVIFGSGEHGLTLSTRTAFPFPLPQTLRLNVVTGGQGNDTIKGSDTPEEFLSGGPGNDTLTGQAGADRLSGGPGLDVLRGENDRDTLYGGGQSDSLEGGSGDDQLFGGPDDDVLFGQGDDDLLLGEDGHDRLFGNTGHDQLIGGLGEDVLAGGSGDDTLAGSLGEDTLSGGPGNDKLFAGPGNDLIQGDAGNDTVVFENEWGEDTVDGGIADQDVADFSRVTHDLVLSIGESPNRDDGDLFVPQVDARYGADLTSTLANFQQMLGGKGLNSYIVGANQGRWSGQLLIDDDAGLGTLDLSHITESLDIEIHGDRVIVSEVLGEGEIGNLVSRISARNVENLILGRGENRLRINHDNPSLRRVSPPTVNGVVQDHSVIVDFSALDHGLVLNLNRSPRPNHNDQNHPIPGTTIVQRDTFAAAPFTATWEVSVVHRDTSFALTFGDREAGTHTTQIIDLSEHATNNEKWRAIRQALVDLPNVETVTNATGSIVLATGTGVTNVSTQDPWVFKIGGKLGTNPVLSSASHVVSSLSYVNPDRQSLSVFTDQGASGTLIVRLTGMPEFSVDLKAALKDSSVLEQAIRARGVNVDHLAGGGTHHDPWLIELAGNTFIESVSTATKSRGVVKLRGLRDDRVLAPPPAGRPAAFFVSLTDGNLNDLGPATRGQFQIDVTNRATNETRSKQFRFDVTADELRKGLSELIFNDGLTTNVTGDGVPGDPWFIELSNARNHDFDIEIRNVNDSPGPPVGNLSDISSIFDARYEFDVRGIIGGSHGDQILGPATPLGGLNVDLLASLSGGGGDDYILGGAGPNALGGGDGNDTLSGGDGDDVVDGQANHDIAAGGPGNDVVRGGTGNDLLLGGTGNDTVQGGHGEDTLQGGLGHDELYGGEDEDTLIGGLGMDRLDGGADDDTYVFEDAWGYDVIRESDPTVGNDDVLDFSQVTEPVTHVLSGGALISGVGNYQLKTPQESLRGFRKPSTGEVDVYNELGFLAHDRASNAGDLTVEAIRETSLSSLRHGNSVWLRFVANFGAGPDEYFEVRRTGEQVAALNSVAALSTALNNALQTEVARRALPNGAAIAIHHTDDRLRIELTRAGGLIVGEAALEVLPMRESVYVGQTDEGNSILQRIEGIVAADADNTFIFGDDWGQYETGLLTTGLGTGLSNLEPDLLTAMRNFGVVGQENRTLVIDNELASQNGHRLVLDFRQVTKTLAWNFVEEDGRVSLEIEREEEITQPFIRMPIELGIFRFNNIEIKNIDANTIIYTGRKQNVIRIGPKVDLKATIIGSSGIQPVKELLSPSNIVPILAGSSPPLAVSNLIDYTRFDAFRATSSELGGIGGGTGLLNTVNPFPFHTSGIGNKAPSVSGARNATLINLFSARNAGGASFVAGTHQVPGLPAPLPDIGFTDDYRNSIPDEFRQYVAPTQRYGQNNIIAGVGGLQQQLVDSLMSSDAAKLYGYLPGLPHVMAGLTGADNYEFHGLWGLGVVIEPPKLEAQGQFSFASAIDTLDFSGITSDLHVTLFEVGDPEKAFKLSDISGKLGNIDIGLGVTLAVVTTFDPTGLSVPEMILRGLLSPLDFAIANHKSEQKNPGAGAAITDSLEFLEGLAFDGGVVVATGIEGIVGGKHKTTVHFRDDFGGVPSLPGRLVGQEIVLDYSDLQPEDIPGGDEKGVELDLSTFDLSFDWLDLGHLLTGEGPDGDHVRENDPSGLTSFIKKFNAVAGSADLIFGDRNLNVGDMLKAVGTVSPALDSIYETVFADWAVNNVYNAVGTSGHDTISGNHFDNIFIGQGGADTIHGHGGTDTFSYGPLSEHGMPFTDSVTINVGAGQAWVGGSGDQTPPADTDLTTFTSIEAFAGGSGDDFFFGAEGDETYVFAEGWGRDQVVDLEGSNKLNFDLIKQAGQKIGQVVLAALLDSSGDAGSISIADTSSGSDNSQQTITIDAASGAFLLKYGDEVAMQALDVSSSDLAGDIQAALETISALSATGAVSVTDNGDGTFDVSFDSTKVDGDDIESLSSMYYADDWQFIATRNQKDQLTAIGNFKITDETVIDQSFSSKVADKLLSSGPSAQSRSSQSVGTLSVTLSDQERLESGLESFAAWVGNAGNILNDLFGSVPQLPFMELSLEDVLGLDGVGDTAQKVADKINNQVLQAVTDAFAIVAPGEFITTQQLIDSSDILRGTTSTNLREFRGTVELGSFNDGIVLDFTKGGLGDFGLTVQQSTPVIFTASLDLDFTFGLDDQDQFYIEDPTIFGRLSLGHDQPLDISVSLGPLGLGIEDGMLEMSVGLGFGTDGRLDIDTMDGDVDGSLFGSPTLDSDASFDILLPIELQGALAGMQDEPAVIYGSFGGDGSDTDLAGFFGALGSTLLNVDFSSFFEFKNVSLDLLLDGIIAGLNGLVGMTSEAQALSHKAAEGAFRLSFDGRTTDPLDVATATAREITDALEGSTGLPNYPEGISVSVSGSGTVEDPWLIQFIEPDSVDVTQQVTGVPLVGFLTEGGGAANFTTTTISDGGEVDQNSLAFKQLPFVDKSLVDMLGNGSVDIITQIKQALIEVRSTLSDMQTFEIDVNFAIDNAFDVGRELGDKQVLQDAVAVLRAVSPSLDGLSTDGDLALALGDSDELDALLLDRTVVAAAILLKTLDSSFDGDTTDEEIAVALAHVIDSAAFDGLVADRAILQGNSAYLDADAVLKSLGLDETATIASIEDVLRNEPTDQAKTARNFLALGDDAEAIVLAQAGALLVDLGLAAAVPSNASQLPSDAAIAEAMAARDLLGDQVFLILQDMEGATRLLRSIGLSPDDPSTLTDAAIEATLFNADQVDAATAALLIGQSTDPAIIATQNRLGLLGLHASSDDFSLARAIVDDATFENFTTPRDLLATAGVVVADAESRLSALGFDPTQGDVITDGDLALAFVNATPELTAQLPALQAARDKLTAFDTNKIITLSYLDSQLFVGFQFVLSGGTTFDLEILEQFLRDLGLPNKVLVETDGEVRLEGGLSIDFEVGVDLEDLEDGITFDDLFIQLDDLTVSGSIETQAVNLALGYGPLSAQVSGGALNLDAGLQFRIDADGSTRASLADLRERGFSLIEVTPTHSSLEADLPVSLAIGGSTAAATTLRFNTDDLFGDISNLIAELPSLDDIANLSIDQIIAGLKQAVDFIEELAFDNQATVNEIPLVREYLDDALRITREGLAFVETLQSVQTQRLFHDGVGGDLTLQLEGDAETFTVASNATAADLQSAIESLTSIAARITAGEITQVQVNGIGTEEDPWVIAFVGPVNNVDVPKLLVIANNLLDAGGAVANVTIESPDVAKDLAAAKAFLERALGIQEIQTQRLHHNAADGRRSEPRHRRRGQPCKPYGRDRKGTRAGYLSRPIRCARAIRHPVLRAARRWRGPTRARRHHAFARALRSAGDCDSGAGGVRCQRLRGTADD